MGDAFDEAAATLTEPDAFDIAASRHLSPAAPDAFDEAAKSLEASSPVSWAVDRFMEKPKKDFKTLVGGLEAVAATASDWTTGMGVAAYSGIQGAVTALTALRAGLGGDKAADEASKKIADVQSTLHPYLVYEPKTEEGKAGKELLDAALDRIITRPVGLAADQVYHGLKNTDLSSIAVGGENVKLDDLTPGGAAVAATAANTLGQLAAFGVLHKLGISGPSKNLMEKVNAGEKLTKDETKAFESHLGEVGESIRNTRILAKEGDFPGGGGEVVAPVDQKSLDTKNPTSMHGVEPSRIRELNPEISEDASGKVADRVNAAITTGKYDDILHPQNPTARAVFKEATGIELPHGVEATKKLFTGDPFSRGTAPSRAADVEGQLYNPDRYFTASGQTPLDLIRRNGGISTKELLKQDFKESLGRAGLNDRTFNPLNFMRKDGMALDSARELINHYLPEGRQLQTPADLLAYLEEHGNRPMGEPMINEARVNDAAGAYAERQAKDAFFDYNVDNPDSLIGNEAGVMGLVPRRPKQQEILGGGGEGGKGSQRGLFDAPLSVDAEKSASVKAELERKAGRAGLWDGKIPPDGVNYPAIRAINGDIYYSKSGGIHASIIEDSGLNPVDVKEGGWITRDGYKPSGTNADGIAERAKAKQRIAEKRANANVGVTADSDRSAQTAEIQPTGHGDFGPIYTQFIGKPKEAINHLVTVQHGEAIGALNHPEVGSFDLPWGEAGTGKSDGWGLSKIAKFHPEVLNNLQDVISAMTVKARSINRVKLESANHEATVRLDWNGKQKRWLITAYEIPLEKRKGSSSQGGSTLVPEDSTATPPVAGNEPDSTIGQKGEEVNPGGGKSQLAPEIGRENAAREMLGGHEVGGLAGEASRRGDTKPMMSMEDAARSFVPGHDAAKESIGKMKTEARSIVLPTSLSPQHLKAAELQGAHIGWMHRFNEGVEAQLKDAQALFNKMGIDNPNTRLRENPGVKFIFRVEQGIKQATPKLEAIAENIRKIFNDLKEETIKANPSALPQVRENYFPGMWKESDAMGKFLAKRPFEGSASFLKAKIFDDIMQGIDAGFHPISNNPIDLVNLKVKEMTRYIMAHRTMNELESHGAVKAFKLSERPDAGKWAKIDDKYGTVYAPPPEAHIADEFGHADAPSVPGLGPQLIGHRYALIPNADIMNNYLSKGITSEIYKNYMAVASTLNQTQLGVGSFFHVGFTAGESQVSAGAELLKNIDGLTMGKNSLADVTKSLTKYPQAIIAQPLMGREIIKEWKNPGTSQNLRIQQIAKAAELAGAGFKMEQGLRTYQSEAMLRNWHGGERIKAVARSPLAAIELAAKPIMEYLVPAQKAGLFAELAGRLIEMNPGVPLERLTSQFRQAWNRVDARLGQVRNDRLFLNNVVKNIVQGVVRAPGWTGGTIAEIGGGVIEGRKWLNSFLPGQKRIALPDRTAYVISLAITTGSANGAMTYALTGTKPEGMDFWAFRDGTFDEKGRPNRFLLPMYSKDVFAYYENPKQTLLNKATPAIGVISSLAQNRDYYGVEIFHPDDPNQGKILSCGSYVLKQYIPFWMRGAAKAAGAEGAGTWEQVKAVGSTLASNPAKIIGPQFGIMPATSEYLNTPAQKLMGKYMADKMPIGTRTQEQFEKSQTKKQATMALRNNKEFSPELQKKFDALTPADKISIAKESQSPGLVNGLKHLDPQAAVNIYKVANDSEREMLKGHILMKIYNALEKGHLDPDVAAGLFKHMSGEGSYQ